MPKSAGGSIEPEAAAIWVRANLEHYKLLMRLTMIARGPRIEAVFYPVPKPEQTAQAVVSWLMANHLPSP